MHISVVSPVYKTEKIIPLLVDRLCKILSSITDYYEIILVDDRSPDRSWVVMQEISKQNKRVKSIRLSRNFGQHYAITCGLDYARGEWVVVMDCDLQDKPEEIEKLYQKAMEGYDIVLARRFIRQDGIMKKLSSLIFYKVLGYLTGSEQDETVANFGIYNKKVIDVLSTMRESIRYFPAMIKWVGFYMTKVDVEHCEREDGNSTYSFNKLFKLALDIILAYSDKPLMILTKVGFAISSISILASFIIFVRWLNGQVSVLGYTSLILSFWLLSGMIIFTLGVVGLYIGKTFERVKDRPIYVIDNKLNLD